MLKQRIITALVLAALFLSFLFCAPFELFALFIGVIIITGAWEWAKLCSIDHSLFCGIYAFLFAVLMAILFVFCGFSSGQADLARCQPLLLTAGVWWAIALLWVQSYPGSALLWGSVFVRLLMGFLVLVPAWLGMILIVNFDNGPWLLLLAVLIVVCSDIGAYFVGRTFGKHKLAPQVSPGKTIEGFLGGFAAVFLLTLAILFFYQQQTWQWLLVATVTALASVLGDLLESMVKRHRGVKDSGTILPGHGGILDRIDSLSAALPVFSLFYVLLIVK